MRLFSTLGIAAFLLVFMGCASESSEGDAGAVDSSGGAVAAPASAPGAPVFNGRDSRFSEVSVELGVNPASGYKDGDEVTLTFKARVEVDGWHLYSARRDGEIAYNPTELIVYEDETKGVSKVGDMVEDKVAKERMDDLLDGLVRDFSEKEVVFTQKVKVEGEAPVLVGELSFQYCNPEGACKFAKLPVEWAVPL